jgi:hypothetical protein
MTNEVTYGRPKDIIYKTENGASSLNDFMKGQKTLTKEAVGGLLCFSEPEIKALYAKNGLNTYHADDLLNLFEGIEKDSSHTPDGIVSIAEIENEKDVLNPTLLSNIKTSTNTPNSGSSEPSIFEVQSTIGKEIVEPTPLLRPDELKSL